MNRCRLPWLFVLVCLGGKAFCQSATDAAGEWTGAYTCIQGQTSLQLGISMQPDGKLSALFRFGNMPSNRSVPDGCFVMNGAFDRETRRVILFPAQWRLRPPGFVMVGLEGKLDPDGRHFDGTVTGGSLCTTFDLERSDRAGADDRSCGSAPSLMAQR